LSTITKPRAGRAQPTGDPVTRARRHIASVRRQVSTILQEDGVNRSTRAQRAQRVKAEAFDELGRILHAKE
jgi:hypothetical protein